MQCVKFKCSEPTPILAARMAPPAAAVHNEIVEETILNFFRRLHAVTKAPRSSRAVDAAHTIDLTPGAQNA
jgi:hypothetical protein